MSAANEPTADVLIPINPEGDDTKAEVATPEICCYAFDALFCQLTKRESVPPKASDEKYPLFVTWNSGPSRRLRGCIGTFEPQPLYEGLVNYALTSALHDSRFAPITKRELPSLECCVSLLTNFEDGSSYLDWTIGIHGIHISFTHPALSGVLAGAGASEAPSPLSASPAPNARPPRSGYPRRPLSATYLPEVMPEQGWDKLDAIDSAIRKAGWDGRITEDLRRSIKLRRYQSSKCCVSYEEFIAWREEQGLNV